AAWVNHYYFKSTEEYLWKRSRSGGNTTELHSLTRRWLRYFADQHWSTDLVHDDRILRCGKGFQECYDALLSITGVPEILEEVHDAFQTRMKRIRTQLLNDPAIARGDQLVQRLLDTCLRD